MYSARILTITNRYSLNFGYVVHRYSRLFGTYRISYHGLISLLLITGLYWTCLWEHYAKQQQIHIVRVISQLLHDCIYIHLYMGICNVCLVICEYHTLHRYSCALADLLVRYTPHRLAQTKSATRAITLQELFVYYKYFSNAIVLVTLTAYNLWLIDWANITVTKILLTIGLAYPHLLIANVLRFFTVHSQLITEIWQDANRRLADHHQPNNGGVVVLLLDTDVDDKDDSDGIASTIKKAADDAIHKSLESVFETFEQCEGMFLRLNNCVQKQLMMLMAQHSLVLFMAVHVWLKVHLVWHLVLSEVDLRLVQVNFSTYAAMICNDYVCLLVSAVLCRNEVKILVVLCDLFSLYPSLFFTNR